MAQSQPINDVEALEQRMAALEKLVAGIALVLSPDQRNQLKEMLGELLGKK